MMPFDDDEFDMDDDAMSPEEEAEINERMKKEKEAVKKHPLFVQACEIEQVLDSLLGYDKTGEERTESHAYLLHESLVIVKAKLYSALASGNYLISMQNASIIRDHAQFLLLSNHHLEHLEFDKAYVNIFWEEMEKFRELFVLWAKDIKELDREDMEDEWGLF
ncbi:MAG TPA: hypothetical protein PL029_00760 [Bacteroidia bacterium]|nr:hypothetical protein [Bacteroidia bacterium]